MDRHDEITWVEIHRIEREARRMRAEAVRGMFAALGRAIARVAARLAASRRTDRTA